MTPLLLLLAYFGAYAARPAPAPNTLQVAAELLGAGLTSNEAFDEVAVLCDDIGHRLAGSKALDNAITWSAEQMRADGLTVHTEPVSVHRWVRGAESASLLAPSPSPLHILGLGDTVATPPEGLSAEVVVVHAFDALDALGADVVRGKLVLYDVPWEGYGDTVRYRVDGPDHAAKLGAIAVLVRSVAPTSLDTPHTGTLGYSGEVDPIPAAAITHEGAAKLARLAARGLHPKVQLLLSGADQGEVPSANVVGQIDGRERPDEVVVLGCHLDSWDVGQGAQDDGIGCTMVMEAAALIAARPIKPRRSVRVVLFANEENGLAGGKAYAVAHAAEASKIVAMLEADTGSGAPLGWRVDVRRGQESVQAADLERALQALAPLQALIAPLGASTLEGSWSGADIGPTVALGPLGLGLKNEMSDYWPIHHTPADTVDKIDPMLVKHNVAVIAATAWFLADLSPRILPAAAAE